MRVSQTRGTSKGPLEGDYDHTTIRVDLKILDVD